MEFLLGVITSLVASVILIVITRPTEIAYFVRDRRRNRHLNGTWHEYHLTTDSAVGEAPRWVHHEETIRVTAFGHVRGRSLSKHHKEMEYRIAGTIRDAVMRLRYRNRTTDEAEGIAVYPNLLSDTRLVGIWIGQDFDTRWCSAPIILSRDPIASDAEREELARSLRLLGPPPRSRFFGPRRPLKKEPAPRA